MKKTQLNNAILVRDIAIQKLSILSKVTTSCGYLSKTKIMYDVTK